MIPGMGWSGLYTFVIQKFYQGMYCLKAIGENQGMENLLHGWLKVKLLFAQRFNSYELWREIKS